MLYLVGRLALACRSAGKTRGFLGPTAPSHNQDELSSTCVIAKNSQASNLIPNPRNAHRPSSYFRIAIVFALVELVFSALLSLKYLEKQKPDFG